MKTRLRSPALLVAAALLIAPVILAVQAPSAAHAAVTATVKIANFEFTPGTITVPAGSTVTWTNGDDDPHTVTADDGGFKSKALDTGESYSFTFAKPGEYRYHCSLHPHMVGRVVVTP